MVSRLPDLTLERGGTWEQASFTVPIDVPDERVQFLGDKYQLKFGKVLETEGLEVLWMSRPFTGKGKRPVDEDRRAYFVKAWCKRRPIEIHMDIPDNAVGDMIELGLKLQE